MLGQVVVVGATTLTLLGGATAPVLAHEPLQRHSHTIISLSDTARNENGSAVTTVSYRLSPRRERGRDPGETRLFLRLTLVQDGHSFRVRGRESIEDLVADGQRHRTRVTVDPIRGRFHPGRAIGTLDLLARGSRVVDSDRHTVRIVGSSHGGWQHGWR